MLTRLCVAVVIARQQPPARLACNNQTAIQAVLDALVRVITHACTRYDARFAQK